MQNNMPDSTISKLLIHPIIDCAQDLIANLRANIDRDPKTIFDAAPNMLSEYPVRQHFSDLVFETIIPRTVRLAEAPSYGQPISVYAPSSNGAESYAALAREVLVGDGVKLPALEI